MLLSQGINVCMEYHRSNSRDNTIKAYEYVLGKLYNHFVGRDMESLSSEEMLLFLNHLCEGVKQRTKVRPAAMPIHPSTSCTVPLLENHDCPAPLPKLS